jgi:hypothetical protein
MGKIFRECRVPKPNIRALFVGRDSKSMFKNP